MTASISDWPTALEDVFQLDANVRYRQQRLMREFVDRRFVTTQRLQDIWRDVPEHRRGSQIGSCVQRCRKRLKPGWMIRWHRRGHWVLEKT